MKALKAFFGLIQHLKRWRKSLMLKGVALSLSKDWLPQSIRCFRLQNNKKGQTRFFRMCYKHFNLFLLFPTPNSYSKVPWCEGGDKGAVQTTERICQETKASSIWRTVLSSPQTGNTHATEIQAEDGRKHYHQKVTRLHSKNRVIFRSWEPGNKV